MIEQHAALLVSRWEGFDAEQLLKVDITKNLHTQLVPKELYASATQQIPTVQS